jgi:hypothetical protein
MWLRLGLHAIIGASDAALDLNLSLQLWPRRLRTLALPASMTTQMAIAVPFDLMAPAVALGRLGDQRRDAGLNPSRRRREAGDRFGVGLACLGPFSRRVDHRSTSPFRIGRSARRAAACAQGKIGRGELGLKTGKGFYVSRPRVRERRISTGKMTRWD